MLSAASLHHRVPQRGRHLPFDDQRSNITHSHNSALSTHNSALPLRHARSSRSQLMVSVSIAMSFPFALKSGASYLLGHALKKFHLIFF